MKYVLFFIAILFSNQVVALNCEKQPTCEDLNYSKDDDPQCAEDGYILCPFDFSYKKCAEFDCEKLGFTQSNKSSWCGKISKCPNDESYTACKALCDIGDVYYADGTCGYANDYDGSKTPVGVVYWVTDNGRHGKVINLHDLGKESESSPFDPRNPYNTEYRYLYWGYFNYDIPELTNYDQSNVIDMLREHNPDLYDGKGNTDKILEAEGPSCNFGVSTADYYKYCVPEAAQAARDFYPLESLKNDSKVGKGKWYLPAIGELMDLYGYDNNQLTEYYGTSGSNGDNKNIINNTLNALKGKDVETGMLSDCYYWSSSEYNNEDSRSFNMSVGHRTTTHKYGYHCVRASLEF